MRQLKFRFWNPSTGEMSFSHDDATIWQGMLVCEGDTIPLQFTGRCDKNGVEIYEKDIVNFAVKKSQCSKCDHDVQYSIASFCPGCGSKIETVDFVRVATIEFSDKGAWCLAYKDQKGRDFTWNTYFAEVFIEWIERVGNVFEHRHLLDK